jgi:hypothetical protein
MLNFTINTVIGVLQAIVLINGATWANTAFGLDIAARHGPTAIKQFFIALHTSIVTWTIGAIATLCIFFVVYNHNLFTIDNYFFIIKLNLRKFNNTMA